MQEGAHQNAPMYLVRSLHYRKEGKVDQVRGWRRRFLCTRVLKILSARGKLEAGREFQFLEVIGTNVLPNEVVRHFSNLTAKECWESCYEQSTLWGESLTLTHQSTCRDSIYSKGKAQRHFIGELASRGSR